MNILKRIVWAGTVSLCLASMATAAHVVSAEGEVERGRGEPAVWAPLSVGAALEPGDRVRTGTDGRAELRLGRVDIRLYPDSVLRVPTDMTPSRDPGSVQLEEGVSLFDVRPAPTPFEVRMPEVVVSVKGTRFSVALGASSASVAVYRGTVGVRSLALGSAREVLIREGFAATGSASESFELDWVDSIDPWDDFGSGTLPDVWHPEPDLGGAPPPPSGAVENLTMAARAEAVTFAAERHPEVRERLEQAHAARMREQGLDPESMDPAVPSPSSPAAMAAAMERDSVADVRERVEAMQEEYVEAWMNGGTPGGSGGGGPGDPPFDIDFVTSGPNPYVEVLNRSSGQTWNLDQDFFENVLDGSQNLPGPLQALLATQGIHDPEVFVQQLLVLFNQ